MKALSVILIVLSLLFLYTLPHALAQTSRACTSLANLQPGEWCYVPNSNLRGVLPTTYPPNYLNTVVTGYGGPSGIIRAWNSAAYDTLRDKLIIATAGGHADYGGNEVYAFSTSSLTWQRLTDPSQTYDRGTPINSCPSFTTCTCAQPSPTVNICQPDSNPPDGLRPVSVHTYDGQEYLPNVDRVMQYSGSRWPEGWWGSKIWLWNPDATAYTSANGGWEQRDGIDPGSHDSSVVYDPITGHVFIRIYDQLMEYNPLTHAIVQRTTFDNPIYGKVIALDPQNRRLLNLKQGGIYYYDLTQSGAITPLLVQVSGATEILDSYAPGFEFHSPSGKFVAWSGEAKASPTSAPLAGHTTGDVYTFDFETCLAHQLSPTSFDPSWCVIERLSPTSSSTLPTNPPFSTSNYYLGTFGRFRYIPQSQANAGYVPQEGLFILVNSIDENVFVYRPSFGTGTSTATQNTITITEAGGLSPGNYPLQNYPVQIGRVSAQGEIPECIQALLNGALLPTQDDVKNRWPDGTRKFGIVTFLLPQLQANEQLTVYFVNQPCNANAAQQSLTTNDMLSSYNFDAQIQLTQGTTETISSRRMLQDSILPGNAHVAMRWLEGSLSTSIVLADHLTKNYDVGWKREGSEVLLNPRPGSYGQYVYCPTCNPPEIDTTILVNDASWAQANDILLFGNNGEEVQVVSVTNNPSPAADIIEVVRNFNGAAQTLNPQQDYVYITKRTWGPITTSADDKFKSYRPIIEATFFPTINKVRVRITGEIADSLRLQDLEYDLSLSVGQTNPQNVHTQTGITHPARTRWSRGDYWIGGAPSKINIDHNMDYISSTGALPYFRNRQYSDIDSRYQTWFNSNRDIFEPGLLDPDNLGGGHDDEHGWVPPLWDIVALDTGHWKMFEVMYDSADRAGTWPIHYREGDAARKFDYAQSIDGLGKVVSIRGRPSFHTNNDLAFCPPDQVKPVSHYTNGESLLSGPWEIDTAHYISGIGYVPYLTTGKFGYLEQMYYLLSWAPTIEATAAAPWAGIQSSNSCRRGLTGREGVIHRGSLRGHGRVIAQRAYTAFIAPDNSPEKQYALEMIYEAAAEWDGERANSLPASLTQTYQSSPQTIAPLHSNPAIISQLFDWGHTVGYGFNYGNRLGATPPDQGPFFVPADDGSYAAAYLSECNYPAGTANWAYPQCSAPYTASSCPSCEDPNNLGQLLPNCPACRLQWTSGQPCQSPCGYWDNGLDLTRVKGATAPWQKSLYMGALTQADRMGFTMFRNQLAFLAQNYLIQFSPFFQPLLANGRIVEYAEPTISRITNQYFQSLQEYNDGFVWFNQGGYSEVSSTHHSYNQPAVAATQYVLDSQLITAETPLAPVLTQEVISQLCPGQQPLQCIQGLEIWDTFWEPFMPSVPQPNWDVLPPPASISCTPGLPSPCNTGLPPLCSAGEKICNAQGNGYGPCTPINPLPQNTPTETCDNQDNDCDGTTDEGCDCAQWFNGAVCVLPEICSTGTYYSQAAQQNCCTGTCSAPASIPSGLVMAFNFEASATTVSDVSGNNNHGTLQNGVQQTNGKYGNGLLFDGVDDYISVPDSPTLNPANGVTVTAWVKNANQGMILGKGFNANQYLLYITPNNILRFFINEVNGPQQSYTATAAWTHIAGVYDGSDVSLYKDGILIGTVPYTAPIQTDPTELNIGRWTVGGYFSNSINDYFTGSLDEIRIYNRGLSSAEVLADMNTPLPQTGQPLQFSSPTFFDTNEGRLFQFLVSATGGNGNALTYSAQNLPAFAQFDPNTHTFSWPISFTQSGTHQITFTVSDGTNQVNQIATVTVKDCNLANAQLGWSLDGTTRITSNRNVNEGTQVQILYTDTTTAGESCEGALLHATLLEDDGPFTTPEPTSPVIDLGSFTVTSSVGSLPWTTTYQEDRNNYWGDPAPEYVVKLEALGESTVTANGPYYLQVLQGDADNDGEPNDCDGNTDPTVGECGCATWDPVNNVLVPDPNPGPQTSCPPELCIPSCQGGYPSYQAVATQCIVGAGNNGLLTGAFQPQAPTPLPQGFTYDPSIQCLVSTTCTAHQACTTDEDTDGIMDRDDLCPGTSTGTSVNIYGQPLPLSTEFTDPETTTFQTENLQTSILTLKNNYGKLSYNQPVDLVNYNTNTPLNPCQLTDINTAVDIAIGTITVDPASAPNLNRPATVTLINQNFNNPAIYFQSASGPTLCTTCAVTNYQNGKVNFTVNAW